MSFYITALTIAGSDCSGGAGIQADIKTMSSLGVYATSVVSSITVQNTCGVEAVYAVEPQIVSGQIRSIMTDFDIRFAKIGMVNDCSTIAAIADVLDFYPIPFLIIDPVMVSSSGTRLMQADALSTFCQRLLPKAKLVTPNIPEAEILSSMTIRDQTDMKKAAGKIMEWGCSNVLIKGGHLPGKTRTDYLFIQGAAGRMKELSFTEETVCTENTHGTGCTLSSAITAYLARGNKLEEAVSLAKNYVHRALVEGCDVKTGHGHGPLDHFFAPEKLIKRMNYE